jgi:hypothetical protein
MFQTPILTELFSFLKAFTEIRCRKLDIVKSMGFRNNKTKFYVTHKLRAVVEVSFFSIPFSSTPSFCQTAASLHARNSSRAMSLTGIGFAAPTTRRAEVQIGDREAHHHGISELSCR